ncbi:hypothetical protein ATN38_05805 [Rhodococcus sp. FH8]|nr:hypothetical protein [Rhodococcus sp. FH8]
MAVSLHHGLDAVRTDEHDFKFVQMPIRALRCVVRTDGGMAVQKLALMYKFRLVKAINKQEMDGIVFTHL